MITKAATGTLVTLVDDFGMKARSGATAIVTQDFCIGDTFIYVQWIRDERAPYQFDGAYFPSLFEITSLMPSQKRFATAWLDDDELTLTGDAFASQMDADNFANAEVEAIIDTTMVVLQMVSKHSSSAKVVSEKLT